MTHRNSPDEVVLSNFDINLKYHPVFILRRVLEDYNQAIVFLDDFIITKYKSANYGGGVNERN